MISLLIDSVSKKDFYFLDANGQGILIPDSQSMTSVFASLRMKHDVLILMSRDVPEVDLKKRFSFGDHFIHLSPRFLSYLGDNYSRQTLDFPHLKAFLISSK